MLGRYCIALLLCACVWAQAGSRPNIVYVMIDDLGWHNVGFHNPEIISPALDAIQSKGIELTRHYTYQYCSPTRSSLMTGRLPIHVNERNSPITVPNGGVPREMTMISAKLKTAGYATHHLGKWHMGMAYPDVTPSGRGFDTSLGYFEGAEDHYTQKIGGAPCLRKYTDLWNTDEPASKLNGTMYSGYLYSHGAVKIIETHDKRVPLFMYVALQNVHSPLQVPDEYVDRYPNPPENEHRRLYQGMTTFADETIANITQALVTAGLWDNTLLVITSDNGGPTYRFLIDSVIDGGGNNFPLKGGKTSDWEGGVRTVGLVSGGLVPENLHGTKQDGYVHVCDWYSTFCYLAGVDPTDHRAQQAGYGPIDSINMWPLLSGQISQSPRKEIVFSSTDGLDNTPQPYANFISGQYKLLVGSIPYAGWTGPSYPNATNVYLTRRDVQDCSKGCLYDIINDPNEYQELSATHPAILAAMMARSQQIVKTRLNITYEEPDARACLYAQLNGGFWGPFLS